MTERREENRVRFDKTISLGNILTIVMLLIGVFTGWSSMDKRVVVLEEARSSQRERDTSQDQALRDNTQAVKEALTDLRRSVEKVADKMGEKK